MNLRVVGGSQCLPMTLVDRQPCLLSQGLGGHCERKEEEALREAGAGQPCPLRWKWSPGLPKPLFDCALVIPSLWPWEKASASGVPVSRLCECQYAQSLGRVRLCDPRHCSLPGPFVHGISQATGVGHRFLLQGIFQTQGSSSASAGGFLTSSAPWEALCEGLL